MCSLAYVIIIVVAMETAALQSTQMDMHVPKYKGKLFNTRTLVHEQIVSCQDHDIPEDDSFAADTWICKDLKIGGRRLRSLDIPGMPKSHTTCRDLQEDSEDPTRPGINDIGTLCEDLMHVHGDKRALWVAMVTETSCEKTLDERMIFRDYKNDTHKWETFRPGRGFIVTLQCVGLPPE